jgi:hypothetical protein
MKITTDQESISPQRAEEILAKHYERVAQGEFKQRHIYKSIVRKYAADMAAGHWDVTPEPIIFDENGDLANGQHRLEAVRLSGKTITFTVSNGWPPEVIDNIEHGKSRTVANQLHLHGQANATLVASTVNCIVRVCYRGEAPPISYHACLHILDKLDMKRHIDRMLDISSAIKKAGRTVGPLAFYRTISARKADEFMERIVNLDLEKDTGPALYAKYMRERTVNDQGDAVKALCVCIKLWDTDETASHIRGGGLYGVDYLADKNKKLVAQIRELFGSRHDYSENIPPIKPTV